MSTIENTAEVTAEATAVSVSAGAIVTLNVDGHSWRTVLFADWDDRDLNSLCWLDGQPADIAEFPFDALPLDMVRVAEMVNNADHDMRHGLRSELEAAGGSWRELDHDPLTLERTDAAETMAPTDE